MNFHHFKSRCFFIAGVSLAVFVLPGNGSASQLVRPEFVQQQKQATRKLILPSGVTLILRHLPGSGITSMAVGFSAGSSVTEPGKRVLPDWMFSSMSKAAKGYPKVRMNALLEKYSIGMGCGSGVEFSSCSVTSLSEYWDKAFPAFAAALFHPLFDAQDVKLQRERMEASFQSIAEEPGSYSNDVVNRVFYPAGHPYRLLREEALKELGSLHRNDLIAYHKQVLEGPPPVVVVVSDIPEEKIVADLQRIFGNWKGKPTVFPGVTPPSFDANDFMAIEDRDIPTAYIRLKFPAIGANAPEAVASRLMFEIFNEELWDEVRTRRSLSYGVGASQIQYRMGIGSISVSTSKPQEALDAISGVIQRMKAKKFSQAELDRFKVVFSTSYFATQETHGSLATALLNSWQYFGTTDRLYDLPAELERVTPDDVQRLARNVLTKMRAGVVYSKAKFNVQWVKSFNDRIK
jgi:zinc protease